MFSFQITCTCLYIYVCASMCLYAYARTSDSPMIHRFEQDCFDGFVRFGIRLKNISSTDRYILDKYRDRYRDRKMSGGGVRLVNGVGKVDPAPVSVQPAHPEKSRRSLHVERSTIAGRTTANEFSLDGERASTRPCFALSISNRNIGRDAYDEGERVVS